MSEKLDVFYENGVASGIVQDRDIVHKTGVWHESVHMWIMKDSEFLVQKRSSEKESLPGMFDASVAGHVDSGESLLHAVIRETAEEIGVTLSEKDIILAGMQCLHVTHPERGFVSNEFNYVFMSEIRPDKENDVAFIPDPEEIESLMWCDINEIRKGIVKEPDKWCVKRTEIDLIEAALSQKRI